MLSNTMRDSPLLQQNSLHIFTLHMCIKKCLHICHFEHTISDVTYFLLLNAATATAVATVNKQDIKLEKLKQRYSERYNFVEANRAEIGKYAAIHWSKYAL